VGVSDGAKRRDIHQGGDKMGDDEKDDLKRYGELLEQDLERESE